MMRKLVFCFTVFCFVLNAQNPSLVYGPYLQQGGPSSFIVAWRTSTVCDSRVRYGVTKTNLNFTITDGSSVAHHTIALSGLSPNTKYFYTVSNSANTFTCDTFYFFTAPNPGSQQKVRIVATGDCGSGLQAQINTRNAMMNFLGGRYVNCWLILGDNAYNSGWDQEYTNLFFTPYQNNWLMHHTCLYPCIGNHDYANDVNLQESKAVAYFNLFNLPSAGQLGGVASNSEAYYSYNYANIHFISIDSYGTESSLRLSDTLSPQYLWLKQDLQANTAMWTIVYFHHPPFTMGSHNSDTETELVNIRKFVTPLLEKNKVDLVLNGHSHNYERSWLMKGHQGFEASFVKTIHAKDTSTARYNGTANSCPYLLDSINNKGVIYTVCGSSGWPQFTWQASYPHNAMCYSNSTVGIAAYLEVDANRLDAKFLGEDGVIHDQFTMFKNIKKVKYFSGSSGTTFTLNASWNGNYVWSNNGAVTKQTIYSANSSTVVYVRDSLNCFADTFKLSISSGIQQLNANQDFVIYPNPAAGNVIQVDIDQSKPVKKIELADMAGKQLQIKKWEILKEDLIITLPDLNTGTYVLKLHTESGVINRKLILRN